MTNNDRMGEAKMRETMAVRSGQRCPDAGSDERVVVREERLAPDDLAEIRTVAGEHATAGERLTGAERSREEAAAAVTAAWGGVRATMRWLARVYGLNEQDTIDLRDGTITRRGEHPPGEVA